MAVKERPTTLLLQRADRSKNFIAKPPVTVTCCVGIGEVPADRTIYRRGALTTSQAVSTWVHHRYISISTVARTPVAANQRRIVTRAVANQ